MRIDPAYKHDCDRCEFIGTLLLSNLGDPHKVDFYRCINHGEQVTIARFGDGDEYNVIPDANCIATAQVAARAPDEGSGLLLVMAGIAYMLNDKTE